MSSTMVWHFVVLLSVCFISVYCEDPSFFLTADKSVPRIGRSPGKGGNSDFDKFFLKASKSVPRIGRRNESPFAVDQGMWEGNFKYPKWNDVAYLYEYQPELFASDDLHTNFEQHLLGDDPSVYDAANSRFTRNIPERFIYGARK